MLEKIGVATSIFAQNGYDPEMTVAFAKKHNLGAIQLYMDKKLEGSMERIIELQELCHKEELTVLCHSPYFLNKECRNDGKHIAALHNLFPRSQKNYTVLHFDENTRTAEALHTVESLNKAGITVALENFYQNATQAGLAKNLNRFRNVLSQAKSEKLDLIPVYDIPRLFIQAFQPFNPTFLSELLIELVENQKIMLHLIDTKSPKQRREDWAPVGEGTLPYEYIFSLIRQYNITVEMAILEYEDASLAEKSIAPLDKLMALHNE